MKCDAPDPIRIPARSLAPALNRRTTMTRSHFTNDWTSLMVDASLLCADAGMVMALRSGRLMAGGPAAQRELARMFSEKTEAGFEIAGALVARSWLVGSSDNNAGLLDSNTGYQLKKNPGNQNTADTAQTGEATGTAGSPMSESNKSGFSL
jgi:hypothetical protein